MVGDRKGMLYPNVSKEDWISLYGLVVRSHPCPVCGKIVTPSIPAAIKDYRGLVTEDHGCDANGNPSCWIPVGKEALEWKKLFP